MATLFDMEPLLPAAGGLKLNEAQRRAITHGEGPLLVIAGAGTGKTRVITERIRHLLESDASLQGGNILGLTFTKKAAGEMKLRLRLIAGTGDALHDAAEHQRGDHDLDEIEENVPHEAQPLVPYRLAGLGKAVQPPAYQASGGAVATIF